MAVILEKGRYDADGLRRFGIQGVEASGSVMRVGVVNLMPLAQEYELEILAAFSRISVVVEPVWIRLKGHGYKSSDPDVIARYVFFDEVNTSLDRLIVTGAPVETLPFDEVRYWSELKDILLFARSHIPQSMGICWGGLAMGHLLGLNKENFESKLFGVFTMDSLSDGSGFCCPVSTHAGIAETVWREGERRGLVRLLAHAPEIGYLVCQSADGRWLMHFGHPEYGPNRLPEEYRRDLERGRSDVAPPENVNLDQPSHEWKGQSDRFFEWWLSERTP